MRYELPYPSTIFPAWLSEWMEVHKIILWGAADLRDFSTPRDETGQGFPFALSWAIPMNPKIMDVLKVPETNVGTLSEI